ncbi:MAG: hypothetical protein WCX65_00080 [bacterium]
MAGYIEKSDSSAAQARALAAALRGEHFDMYGLGFAARSAARWFSWAPKDALRFASRFASGRIGTPQSEAGRVDTEDMANWAAGLYPQKEYGTLLIGAPSGGVSHIGSILDAPFLTTHFLICFSDLRNVDDVYTTVMRARRLALQITRNNPDLHVVAHYDPVHDRPVLVFINHLRAKLLNVPRAYDSFISRNLKPGGTLVLIQCEYPWLQYRIRPRVSFQVGGLGGISDADYLGGSAEIRDYRARQGGVSGGDGGWRLKGSRYPLERMPESEWGAMPEFGDAVRDYADRKGIRLLTLTADHPERFSELAFELHREASRRDGVEPVYLFADCFNQLDPWANLRSRWLPLWLPYYCNRSFEFASRILRRVPEDVQLMFTMHPSLADPFDMTPLADWIKLMSRGGKPVLFGIDPERFPYDIGHIVDFGNQTRKFSEMNPDPVRTRLDAEDLEATAKEIGIRTEWS